MKNIIDVQYASNQASLPRQEQLTEWANAALKETENPVEISIRIVDENEAAELNEKWRKQSGATNVLSFPATVELEMEAQLLGDIVICGPVIEREACQQDKSLDAHWAHMVIHGTLHLLGYDHNNDNDATEMETLEIKILENLGYTNPYI